MGGGERVDIRANIERKKVRTVLYVGSTNTNTNTNMSYREGR